MKYYNSTEIEQKFNKLKSTEQVQILLGALDYMQQYNGRSIIQCIGLAMNYEDKEGDGKHYIKKTHDI